MSKLFNPDIFRANLRELEPVPITILSSNPFKDYEPGLVYVDVKYLPKIPDETPLRYLFVAIYRASHCVLNVASPTQNRHCSRLPESYSPCHLTSNAC